MTAETGTPAVREATPLDVAAMEGIENAADALLLNALHPAGWAPAPPGAARAAEPGFLLVVAEQPGGPAIGFVHVVDAGGQAHLEQLSVLPEHGRRGLGRRLVRAAMSEARRLGAGRVTLRTFADIPWNAPFYATCGFVRSEPDTDFLRGLVELESDLGLDRLGRRVQMTAALGDG